MEWIHRNKSLKWVVSNIMALIFLWSSDAQSLDLSHSTHKGRYPWEQSSVFEEVGSVKFPAKTFYEDLAGMLKGLDVAEDSNFSMELRPILIASLISYVFDQNRPFGWYPEAGDPNPALVPIFTLLLDAIGVSQEETIRLSNTLSSYALMMPDSSGSAVLELRNKKYETYILKHGPEYGLMLPVKMGFWVEGDYVHIDLLGPKALSWLFMGKNNGMDIEEFTTTVKKAIYSILHILFKEDEFSIYSKSLSPYIKDFPQDSSPFYIFLGTIEANVEPEVLLKDLLKVTNPLHPFRATFFQTYQAFDGIAGFLLNAYNNRNNRADWVPTPNGEILDDLLFLNLMTTPDSLFYGPEELSFYRSLLTPMFKTTFIAPRGTEVMIFKDETGRKIAAIDIGSPYYGQILLKMGAHRAPGTPCKILAVGTKNGVDIYIIDTEFMFSAFFGDTRPDLLTQWDGAFNWPYGQDLNGLALEAKGIFSTTTVMALKILSETLGYKFYPSEVTQNIFIQNKGMNEIGLGN